MSAVSIDAPMGGLANVAQNSGPGNRDVVNSRKLYPWMGSLFYDNSIGSSNYNAFEFKMERRFSAGLQALLAYTWSKSIDTGSSGYFASENGPGGSSSLQDLYDLKGSRSVSSYDIPHVLSLSSVWEIPAWLLGDWQASTVLQLRSGQPYNLSVPGDVANIGNDIAWWNYARPNLVGNPRVAHPTDGNFFNAAAFAIPQFSYGNFGRNVLRTDKVTNLDLSLTKKFPLGSDIRRYFQLRCEAFNLFNIINLGVPGTVVGSPMPVGSPASMRLRASFSSASSLFSNASLSGKRIQREHS